MENNTCVICKKEIQEIEQEYVTECGSYVHAGVCLSYMNEQNLNESTENTVQFFSRLKKGR